MSEPRNQTDHGFGIVVSAWERSPPRVFASLGVAVTVGLMLFFGGPWTVAAVASVSAARLPRIAWLCGALTLSGPFVVGVVVPPGSYLSLLTFAPCGAVATALILRSKRPPKKVLLAVLIALIGLFAYAIAKPDWAAIQTQRLCIRAQNISTIAGFESQAKSFGLNVKSSPSLEPGHPPQMRAQEGLVFSRRFCVVEHRNGVIIKADWFSLD